MPVPARPSAFAHSWRATATQVAAPAVAVAVALAVGAIFIALLGKSPLEVYGAVVRGTLLSHPTAGWYGLGQVIYKATTLVFVGVAVAVGFRAGLFNIGAEGQLYLGAFAAALAGLYLIPAGAAHWWATGVCVVAAFLGGALAALVPATLKAWRGAHEVIVTIMMNFVILHIVNYACGHIAEPESVHTSRLPESALLSRLGGAFAGSAANGSVWIAGGVTLFAALMLARTRSGFEIRMVGAAPLAAEAGGVPLRRTFFVTLLLSGGLAGLGGINFVLGNKGYFEEEFSAGVGFMGIAVALLARNRPLLVIPAAVLLAVLSEGAVAVGVASDERVRVPRQLFDVLQGVILLSVIATTVLFDRWAASRLARSAPAGH